MTTITAVDLRNNLGDYIARASNGEKIIVTYRRGISAVLQAVDNSGSISSSKRLLNTLDKIHAKYADKLPVLIETDAKEQIHKHWIEKYGAK